MKASVTVDMRQKRGFDVCKRQQLLLGTQDGDGKSGKTGDGRDLREETQVVSSQYVVCRLVIGKRQWVDRQLGGV